MSEAHVCSPELVRGHELRIVSLEKDNEETKRAASVNHARLSVLEAASVENAKAHQSMFSTIERVTVKMDERDREHDRRINSLALKVTAAIGLLQGLMVAINHLVK